MNMAIFCLIFVVGFSYVVCEADQATSNDVLLQRVLQENQELRTRLGHLENELDHWKTVVTSDIDEIRQKIGICFYQTMLFKSIEYFEVILKSHFKA